MKIESTFNHPGGVSHVSNYTRLVGFRVSVTEIEKNHESFNVANPAIVTELAIAHLVSLGYEVTK